MNIEQITREYLSSFFGQDLNECVDSLAEEHIAEAIASINLLAKALNEQHLQDKIMDLYAKAFNKEITPDELDQHPAFNVRRTMRKKGREHLGPPPSREEIESLKNLDAKKDEYGNLKNYLNRNEKFISDLSPSEREEIMKTPEYKEEVANGMIRPHMFDEIDYTDSLANLKDFARIKTSEYKPTTTNNTIRPDMTNRADDPNDPLVKLKNLARMQEQVFHKLCEQYNPGYPETGNINYNSPEMQAARERGRRLAEREGRVGPGMYKVPGSEKKFNVGKRLDPNNPDDAALIKQGEEAMQRVEARARENDPDGSRRRARREAADRRMESRADYEVSPAGQAAANRAIDAENQSRATRGLPPLNATAARRLGRRVIASDVARGVADASRRAAANNQPPQSEEDYMASQFPGGVAPAGAETITNDQGREMSVLDNPARPYTTQGIIGNAIDQARETGFPRTVTNAQGREMSVRDNPASSFTTQGIIGNSVNRARQNGFRTTGSTPPVM